MKSMYYKGDGATDEHTQLANKDSNTENELYLTKFLAKGALWEPPNNAGYYQDCVMIILNKTMSKSYC